MHTPAKGTLWEIEVNPLTGKVIKTEQLLDRGCEFPVVPNHQVSNSWRYTYLSVHRDHADLSQEMLGAIARFDRQLGTLIMADMGDHCYPSEPIFVPHSAHSEQGWILTVVYNGSYHRSEVRIYDSENLNLDPLCCLELPTVIPLGFHGTWNE